MKIRSPFKPSTTVAIVSLVVLGVGVGYASRTNLDNDPHIVIPTPVPRPKPNGYDLYVAAQKAIVPAMPPVDAVNDPNGAMLTPAQEAKQYSLARKQAWLSSNKAAFDLFQVALTTPSMVPDMRSNPYSMGSYAALRELARCKLIEANAAKMAKQPNQAMRSSLDTIQMGMDIRRGGGMLPALVGIAIDAIGRSAVEDFDVTINGLNASEAKAAAHRLEGLLANKPTMVEAVQEERWLTLSAVQLLFKTPNWRKPQSEWTFQQVVRARTVSKKQIVERINQSYDDGIALLQLPYGTVNMPLPEESDPISGMLLLNTPVRAQANEARSNIGLKLLLLRLALRAYQLDNKRWPASLTQLSPRYLKAIPTDDFNKNKPFFYRLKGQNYELWSVGPDGKNDNGKPIPPRLLSGTKQKLPATVMIDSVGDFVAGKNR